jgi:hypothetical protein
VFHCIGRAATVLALCCAVGLQWIVLQSVAWTTMLVENSKHVRFSAAIAQTFDGAHPCSLCHAVNKGKNSDKKSDLQSPTPKIDMICPPIANRVLRPFVPFEYAAANCSWVEMGRSPPVPPPRLLFS